MGSIVFMIFDNPQNLQFTTYPVGFYHTLAMQQLHGFHLFPWGPWQLQGEVRPEPAGCERRDDAAADEGTPR